MDYYCHVRDGTFQFSLSKLTLKLYEKSNYKKTDTQNRKEPVEISGTHSEEIRYGEFDTHRA